MTYEVIFWPVPERVRSGRSTARSASSATTRSIPMTAMCTGGSDEHMRPFPSFVTRTIVPVSATAKLTPVIPTGRLEEPAAEMVAGERRELGGVVADRAAGQRLEQVAHLIRGLVDRGDDDVLGRLTGRLDDELAEVGLDDLDPGRLEVLVQADLLGRHRLPLHDHAAMAQDDLGHVAGGIGTRRRSMDDGPGRLELRLERVEERREVVDRPGAGRLARGPEGLDVDALEPADAIVGGTLREPGHVRALARIGQRRGGALLEAAHRASARTVARWTTRTPAPTRDARPSICMTQPGSALATVAAEIVAAEASLSSAMAVDTSG